MGQHNLLSHDRASVATCSATGTVIVTQVFQLPPERIWVSVYEKDDEAYALWRDQVKVPESRIVRMGASDNFWAAGATGMRPHIMQPMYLPS